MNESEKYSELINNEYFNNIIKEIIDDILNKKKYRDEPDPGMKWKRDIVDKVNEYGKFNFHFYKTNIEDVLNKTSNLPASIREIIISLFDMGIYKYVLKQKEYESTNKK